MPWTIAPSVDEFVDDPRLCPTCAGNVSRSSGSGSGQCPTCRAAFISEDPPPGVVYILNFIPVGPRGEPLPRKGRRDLEIGWGDRRQADGTVAKVYRAINRQMDQYTETVRYQDGTVFAQSEPLSHHVGHGTAKHR